MTTPKNKTSISCGSLIVLNLNVRSLKKHLEDLEALAYSLEVPPDTLCLTETQLSEQDDPKSFLVTGYQNRLSKFRDSKGEGIMIQIRMNSIVPSKKCLFATLKSLCLLT